MILLHVHSAVHVAHQQKTKASKKEVGITSLSPCCIFLSLHRLSPLCFHDDFPTTPVKLRQQNQEKLKHVWPRQRRMTRVKRSYAGSSNNKTGSNVLFTSPRHVFEPTLLLTHLSYNLPMRALPRGAYTNINLVQFVSKTDKPLIFT